jgi:hypothetical protein
MPKINSAGVPSYDGQTGQVTNAVGEQFEVNSSLDNDGERTDDYVNEPVGEFEESPAPGIPGQVRPVAPDDGAPDDDSGERQGDEWDPAHPKPAGNQTPAFKPKKSTAPAEKSTAADKK